VKIIQISSGELRIPVEKGGGIEAPILELSLQMSKLGHSVTILDRKYSRDDPDTEYIEGVEVVRLKARRVPSVNFTISFALNQAFFAWKVRQYLAKADFDVVHVHVSIAGLVLSLIAPRLRKRLFYTSHGNRRTKRRLSLLDRVGLFLENRLVKRVRKVIIESEVIGDKLVEQAKLRYQDVVAVPIEVDTDVFSPDLDVGDVGQRYGLEGKINVLFVGRVHPDKGVEYLVKAANIVVQEFGCGKAQFLVVGPTEQFGAGEKEHSPYLFMILRLIEDGGLEQNVILTGAVPFDDLRRLYVACDIFVVPSVVDLGPRVQLEAMASGKPVVGTKVGTMPVWIKDGKSGFLVDPADERQLADKIRYLIDNPSVAKEMGAYGRWIVEEQFSSEKITARLLQVYQEQ
jgi:D-inositol-3-phosphate glycosyltransferase